MKHSIQYRFTAMLLSVVAVTLIAIYLINTFGLESYYVNQKVRAISLAYKSIDNILTDSNGMFADKNKQGEDNNENDEECSVALDKTKVAELGEVLKEYSDKYKHSINRFFG